jgi:phage terminase small subunit
MGGRPAKPIQLHVLNGNKRHLTKEEIDARQKQEQKLRSSKKDYKANAQVKDDPVALAMFKKLAKLYKSIEYVEGLDENVINRYCLLHSEYLSLRTMRQQLLDVLNEMVDPLQRFQVMDKITECDRRLDKKYDLLVKLEDRLFLNPTSRVKNVPKKEPKEKDDPNADLFD